MKRFLRATAALVVGGGLLVAGSLAAAQQTATPPAQKSKWVMPVKGVAELAVLPAKSAVKGKEVVTTVTFKNLATAPIAGLQIDEYWYDKSSNMLPGGQARVRKLIQPGEVVTITMTTPVSPQLAGAQNRLKFKHANGDIKVTQVKKLQ
jgi:hypothetical protein